MRFMFAMIAAIAVGVLVGATTTIPAYILGGLAVPGAILATVYPRGKSMPLKHAAFCALSFMVLLSTGGAYAYFHNGDVFVPCLNALVILLWFFRGRDIARELKKGDNTAPFVLYKSRAQAEAEYAEKQRNKRS